MNVTIKSKISNIFKLGSFSLFITGTVFMAGCGQEAGVEASSSGDCSSELKTSPLLGEFEQDVPIAYIKRARDSIDPDEQQRVLNASLYKPGGNVYLRTFASANSDECNITASLTEARYDANGDLVQAAGDVADLDVSYDGKKLVFSLKKGDLEDVDDDMQPTWNLWEYDIETRQLSRVIPDDAQAEIGNDLDPTYLPNGQIVFTSDRMAGKGRSFTNITGGDLTLLSLLTEGREEPAVNLHIVDPGDGDSIEQISYNQSHELDPTLLSSGKIVYTRWEHAYKGSDQSPFTLFTVNPDGSENELLYGFHSLDPENGQAAYLQMRDTPSGQLLATTMAREGTYMGGDIVSIDYSFYADKNTARSGGGGSGETSITNASFNAAVSAKGRFTTPFPLWDGSGRMLISWAWCEVEDQNGNTFFCSQVEYTDANRYTEVPPAYGIWVYDSNNNTQKHIVLPKDGEAITDPVAIIDRITAGTYPDYIPPKEPGVELDQALYDDEFGLVKIRSVYDTDDLSNIGLNQNQLRDNGTDGDLIDDEKFPPSRSETVSFYQGSRPDERPARFVRIVGPAYIVGTDNQSPNKRDIIGYHEIEPDGSVVMAVPADVPFGIEITDKLGRRTRHHPNWMNVIRGGTVECVGCHEGHTQSTPLNGGYSGTTQIDDGNGGMVNSFPGAVLGAPVPNVGETMAETRDRESCAATTNTCGYRRISADLIFDDVWTDPANADAMNAEKHFAVTYDNLMPAQGSEIPFNLGVTCTTSNWGTGQGKDCRITIDYELHIQPIWEKPRTFLVNNVSTTMACTGCHAPVDRTGDMIVDVPAGQLNLTTVGINDNGNENLVTSYRELTGNDQLQVVVNNVVEYDTELVLDDTVDPPQLVPQRIGLGDCAVDLSNDGNCDRPVRASRTNRNDGSFISKMTSTLGTQDHSGMLNDAELKLIIEWIDTDARYTNIIDTSTN